MPDALTIAAPAMVGSVMRAAADHLRAHGSPTPRLDAELLVAHALGQGRAWVVAHDDAPVPDEAAGELARSLERRAAGEPIAYIRGFKEWLSLRIKTDGRALIPRPETEVLAESAIEEIASRLGEPTRDEPIVVWDVGTGSGCLAVALGLCFRSAVADGRVRLFVGDASADALELAAENLRAHDLTACVELVPSDLLAAVADGLPRPDVVVANLPYIPSEQVPLLPVAASFEPRDALDGGPDGLALIRALLEQLPERVAPRGCALLEIGDGQLPRVRAAAATSGLAIDGTFSDLAGVERVVRVIRSAPPATR